MKQLIVLVATILLGVTISAVVLGFGSTAKSLETKVTNEIDNKIVSLSAISFQLSDR